MTPERWQQINAVLDAVLEQPPARRSAYLDEHCRDDPDLHHEVFSLLEAHGRAEHFLEEPAPAFAAALVPPPNDLADELVGQTIDGYHILNVVGRGGMGIVYKAEDEALSRTVALKMIDPALARDDAFVRRFRREARALARIDSRHIVGVHAMRQTDAGLFIVMEYVDGGTLTDLLAHGPVSWTRALPIISQMLTALEHAHSLDVIHRDIKPSNIMLTGHDVVKVTDFGLAKVRQGGSSTTVTQGIAGTLYYMSPEQVRGAADLDFRSDLYSMGMTIYQMLCGRLPLDPDAGEFAIMRAIVEDDLPPPSRLRPGLPAAVDAAVMKALEKKPDRRYQSAAAMRAAFEALPPPAEAKTVVGDAAPYKRERSLPPRVLWFGAAALFGMVLVLGGYLLWPEPDPQPRFSVTTTPGQAVVFLGGEYVGTTPLSDYRLDAGTDSLFLRIEKADYAPVETTLVARAGVPLSLNINLQRSAVADSVGRVSRATLRITSSPGNARVQINGVNKGSTNASGVLEVADVEPGGVTVHLAKNGYNDWRETVQARSGQTVTVSATLKALEPTPSNETTGTLTVRVEPRGTITVQGENCQAGAPCSVRAGTLPVTCSRDGVDARTSVQVRANRQSVLTCYTERKVAVQVRTEDGTPIWATIVVDAADEGGFSDKVFSLGPGNHRIEVRRNAFDVLTPPQTIRVVPAFEEREMEPVVFQIRAQ